MEGKEVCSGSCREDVALRIQKELKIGDSELTQSLKQGSFYKFLAVTENFKQEDQLVLKGAAKVFNVS